MDEFPVMQVDRSRSQSVEPPGSKPKFWFSDGNRRLLFKAEDRRTGEDWAEAVACHLRGLLADLPLAAAHGDGRSGRSHRLSSARAAGLAARRI